MRKVATIVLFTSVSLVVLGVVLWLFSQQRIVDGEGSGRVRCASNLRQIGIGVTLYANDHGGSFPDSFATLLRNEDLTPDVFICTQTETKVARNSAVFVGSPDDCDYVYLGDGLTSAKITEDTILAFDRVDNHNHDGINILLGDGHVDFIPIGLQGGPAPAWWASIEDQVA